MAFKTGSLVIQPGIVGALQSDGSGNARGTRATDFQRDRDSDSQVASGDDAAILSGSENTASGEMSCIVSGYHNLTSAECSTVVTGSQNSVTGTRSAIIVGLSNTVSGTDSIIICGYDNDVSGTYAAVVNGWRNEAADNYSTILNGRENKANASYSVILNGLHVETTMHGEVAQNSGYFSELGDAQTAVLTALIDTDDASWTELFLDGVSQHIAVPPDTSWVFNITVIGRAVNGNESAGWSFQGVVKRESTLTYFVGTPVKTLLGRDNANWDAAVSVSAHYLEIKVQGVAERDIRWHARIEINSVTNHA